jgi:hypothetical protein
MTDIAKQIKEDSENKKAAVGRLFYFADPKRCHHQPALLTFFQAYYLLNLPDLITAGDPAHFNTVAFSL